MKWTLLGAAVGLAVFVWPSTNLVIPTLMVIICWPMIPLYWYSGQRAERWSLRGTWRLDYAVLGYFLSGAWCHTVHLVWWVWR